MTVWCKGEKCKCFVASSLPSFLSRIRVAAAPGHNEVSLPRKRTYLFTNNDPKVPIYLMMP
jgi:hypothetical protein